MLTARQRSARGRGQAVHRNGVRIADNQGLIGRQRHFRIVARKRDAAERNAAGHGVAAEDRSDRRIERFAEINLQMLAIQPVVRRDAGQAHGDRRGRRAFDSRRD